MSDRRPIKVAVIVAAWKAVPFLDDCLGSLEKIDRQGLDIKAILVDDHSPDETAEVVRKRWPWVEVMRTEQNCGFAGANNYGMRRAIRWGADYIYLLNQDTESDPGFLREAVAVAESDPQIGSVQSLLLLHDQPDKVNSWGNAIHFLGFGYSLGYRKPRDQAPPEVTDIMYASGAAVLYRAAALKRVGLFDETFYMYHEDLDLGWRLRLNGWRNVLAPQSLVWHKYEFSRSISKFYYMERNRYLVLFQNLRLWSLVVLAPWLLVAEIGLFVLSVYGGWWRQRLNVYGYFFTPGHWLDISNKRMSISSIRKLPDREIMRPFTAVIDYQEVSGLITDRLGNPGMRLVWRLVRPLII